MPITPEEALAATDPSLPQDQREAAARNIMAGVAANDAYINSRSELEQVFLRSRGEQVVTHESINQGGGAAAGSVEGTATELGTGGLTRDEEVAQLHARLAELEGGGQ